MHHSLLDNPLISNVFSRSCEKGFETLSEKPFFICIPNFDNQYFCKMRFSLVWSTICITFLILWGGCKEPKKHEKIQIVTTTGIIADCISEIVGEQAEVISLMGPGVDPHLYKASQGDITKLSSADIIIYNGLHLEGKMANMLENYGKQKTVLAVGSYVKPDLLKKVDDNSDLVDPHIWFDPQIWSQGLEGIAKEMSKIEGLESSFANCKKYIDLIDSSSNRASTLLDTTLNQSQRILITSHDAFEYFGDVFQFKVRGLQGISTAAEYGAKDVKQLIDFIISNNVKAVFVETSVSDKNLKAVLEGARARGYDLRIGGTLYSDALGAEGTKAASYIGMLESNVSTISKGLR